MYRISQWVFTVIVELTGSWTVDWGQIWRECVVLNVPGLCSWKGMSFTKRYCESYKDLYSCGIETVQDFLSIFWDVMAECEIGKGPLAL